ncbi:GNAT family N-acetyltransferase [Pontimicrobium aquaticum]|uniref:GNAT family N-acetyltransferase n=1 Tax=Pontimicrobium aquaticum TaxID=2565367 RepID=A0A4U0EMW3_9FLAO|nr:GNAT family N-acetyltransferase [Pontimicrobium aquaticum]TJY32926.1 GNAT family N-acetyltransferase [Pontimicrobium aquaticum]
MIRFQKTDSSNTDFIELVKLLNKDLAISDGEDHEFYNQYNGIDAIKHAVVAYNNNSPIACGALKEYDKVTVEIKRMYTLPITRGKGIATKVLSELECWAHQLGYKRCILETGKKQPKAIALYKKTGYNIIPNYDQYAGVDNSVCFEKLLA